MLEMTTVAPCGDVTDVVVAVVNLHFAVATATPEEALKDVGFETVPA